jgi:Chaperone of endosialidase
MKTANPQFLIVVLIACLGSLQNAHAVSPPPDGCYPNFTTAGGCDALSLLIIGAGNTAFGWRSLFLDTTGSFNTGVGGGALALNNGDSNTAVGAAALLLNTTGGENVAVGTDALVFCFSGSSNVAIGDEAGNGIISGSDIIAIGAGVSGVSSVFGEVSNSCYIGSAFGQTVDPGTGAPLLIDADGKLGTLLSSARYKKDIKPMDQASEVLLALKPVTFHYNYDKRNTPQFGLVAEDVAKVNPNLVARDKKGELLTVRYEQINAMLLNEFLKEHRKVEQLEKQVEALTTGLQKVSAQLDLSKPAPQTVLNKK